MNLKDLFAGKNTDTEMSTGESKEAKRITGKIIHVQLDAGWGFISTPEIPFTRIFFHWTALEPDTLNFTKLRKGMKVEFVAKLFEEKNWRAIKIKVLDNERGENQNS